MNHETRNETVKVMQRARPLTRTIHSMKLGVQLGEHLAHLIVGLHSEELDLRGVGRLEETAFHQAPERTK